MSKTDVEEDTENIEQRLLLHEPRNSNLRRFYLSFHLENSNLKLMACVDHRETRYVC